MLQLNLNNLKQQITFWAKELGFAEVGVANLDLQAEEAHLQNYLAAHFHGEMHYLEKNQSKRIHPSELLPEAKSVICVRMNYLTSQDLLEKNTSIAIFALSKNYTKLITERLEILAQKIKIAVKHFALKYRIFCGNAPILEKALAAKAGLGWIGKNSLLINKNDGSFFFLGEIFINLELPVDQSLANFCGSCTKCIDQCPTKALVAPKILNASRCISYLTIEHKSDIPENLQNLMQNKIFGCDACQKCCPYNKFAKVTSEKELFPKDDLVNASLAKLQSWDEKTFLAKTAQTPIGRIGYDKWRRNLALVKK